MRDRHLRKIGYLAKFYHRKISSSTIKNCWRKCILVHLTNDAEYEYKKVPLLHFLLISGPQLQNIFNLYILLMITLNAIRQLIMHKLLTNKIFENLMKKGIAPTVKLKIMIAYQKSKNVLYSEKMPCRILKLLKNISQ